MSERKIPVHRTDFSLIDSEFDSIRDKFESEMKAMDEEMNRLRSQLQKRQQEFFGRSLTSSSQKITTTSHHSSSDGRHRTELNTWFDDISSPLVQDADGGKVLKLRFDVTDYKPEEIVVKTIDNRLQVTAKHEEKTENRSILREYNREFLLPDGVNPELIKSTLSKDGVLTVEAPLPAIKSGERKIPIMHK